MYIVCLLLDDTFFLGLNVYKTAVCPGAKEQFQAQFKTNDNGCYKNLCGQLLLSAGIRQTENLSSLFETIGVNVLKYE